MAKLTISLVSTDYSDEGYEKEEEQLLMELSDEDTKEVDISLSKTKTIPYTIIEQLDRSMRNLLNKRIKQGKCSIDMDFDEDVIYNIVP